MPDCDERSGLIAAYGSAVSQYQELKKNAFNEKTLQQARDNANEAYQVILEHIAKHGCDRILPAKQDVA